MRIVYITSYFPYGPGEAFLIPEVTELIRQGHSVRIVPLRIGTATVVHDDAKPLLRYTIAQPLLSTTVVALAFQEAMRRPEKAICALGVLLGCLRVFRWIRNLSAYPKGLWVGNIARGWQADHIHAHWASVPATAAMIAGMTSGIPWSFTAHRSDIVINDLLRKKLRRASFARFISHSGIELANNLSCPPPAGRAVVLHMGVSVPPSETKQTAPARPTVLCPASLLAVKGHRYLIDASKLLRDRGVQFELVLVGEGPLRSEIELQVANLELSDHVRIVGHISHDQLIKCYRQAQVSVVVLPSVDLGNGIHEGIPVSLMEAMTYGIPVISTRTGGIPELLEEGAGLLVPDKNPEALAQAMERLLRDEGIRQQVGRRGRQRILEHFSCSQLVHRLVSLFRERSAGPLFGDGSKSRTAMCEVPTCVQDEQRAA